MLARNHHIYGVPLRDLCAPFGSPKPQPTTRKPMTDYRRNPTLLLPTKIKARLAATTRPVVVKHD